MTREIVIARNLVISNRENPSKHRRYNDSGNSKKPKNMAKSGKIGHSTPIMQNTIRNVSLIIIL